MWCMVGACHIRGDCDGIAVCGKFVDVIVSSIDSRAIMDKRLLIIALLLPSCIVADASQASAVVSRSCSLKRGFPCLACVQGTLTSDQAPDRPDGHDARAEGSTLPA